MRRASGVRRQRALPAGATLLALLALGACEQARPYTGTRVFYADLQGGAKVCTVPRDVGLAADRVTEVAMTVVNDGGWCGISVSRGGRAYAAGTVVDRAEHGRVEVRNVGDVTRVDYFPDRGFSGSDSFAVSLLPGGHRMKVAVTVQPGSASAAATPAAAPAASAPATHAPAAATPARRR